MKIGALKVSRRRGRQEALLLHLEILIRKCARGGQCGSRERPLSLGLVAGS
jgi:hypothetical protein